MKFSQNCLGTLKICAHLSTWVQPLHDDEVDRDPGEDEAGDELKVDHPQSELDALILSEHPMPGKKKSLKIVQQFSKKQYSRNLI